MPQAAFIIPETIPTVLPSRLAPPEQCAVYQTRLSQWQPQQSALWALLNTQEQTRALRFRRTELRSRYIIARGLLRRLLGAYLGQQGRDLVLQYQAKGKPELAPPYQALQFNISHSGDMALFAFQQSNALGVDVEWRGRRLRDPLSLAKHYFSPREYAVLAAQPEPQQQRTFLQIWVAKEAVLKATGQGIVGLAEVEIEPPARLLRLADGAERDWRLQDLDVGPNAVACLCVKK